MNAFLGLLFDLTLNIITFGWWSREIGDESVYIKGDGFSRPEKD